MYFYLDLSDITALVTISRLQDCG